VPSTPYRLPPSLVRRPPFSGLRPLSSVFCPLYYYFFKSCSPAQILVAAGGRAGPSVSSVAEDSFRWFLTVGAQRFGGCPGCRGEGIEKDHAVRVTDSRQETELSLVRRRPHDGRMTIRPCGPPSPAGAGLGGSGGEDSWRNVDFLCNILASQSVYIQKRRRRRALGTAKPQDAVLPAGKVKTRHENSRPKSFSALLTAVLFVPFVTTPETIVRRCGVPSCRLSVGNQRLSAFICG
jgi:hypothetical protein